MFVLVVQVFLAIPEIHHEDLISLLLEPHQEILWADIIIGEILAMHPVDPIQQLISNEQDRLQCKAASTEVEQLLQ